MAPFSRRVLSLALCMSLPGAALAKHHAHHHADAPPEPASTPGPASPSPVAALHPLTLLEVRAIELPPRTVPSKDIRALYDAVEKRDDADPDKASKLYDLARLHAENERYYRLRSKQLADKLADSTAQSPDSPDAGSLRAEQQEAEDRRGEWLKSATEKYEYLTSTPAFAKYRRIDQALVALITLYMLQDREADARPLVKRLVDEFPSTLSMPDAYLAFAEFFFEQQDWDKALSFYQRMLKYPASPRHDYATYKEAFCYLETKDYQKGMQGLTELIKRGRKAAEASAGAADSSEVVDDGEMKSAARLAEDARAAAVWTYAQVGAADKAWPFFASLGKKEAPKMMEQLAADYAKDGKDELAQTTWRALLDAMPDSPRRCDWGAAAFKQARARTGASGTPDAMKALLALVALADRQESPDTIAEEATNRCAALRTAVLRQLAVHWDDEMRGADADTLAAALPLFEKYAADAPIAERYDLDFQKAQLVAAQGKGCDAASLFVTVYEHDDTDTGAHRDAAARGAVESWRRCAASSPAAAQRAAVTADLARVAVGIYGHGGGTDKEARKFFEGIDAAQGETMEAEWRAQYAAAAAPPHHHHAH